jgi:hypothetical protein
LAPIGRWGPGGGVWGAELGWPAVPGVGGLGVAPKVGGWMVVPGGEGMLGAFGGGSVGGPGVGGGWVGDSCDCSVGGGLEAPGLREKDSGELRFDRLWIQTPPQAFELDAVQGVVQISCPPPAPGLDAVELVAGAPTTERLGLGARDRSPPGGAPGAGRSLGC